jgi:hypothetical protein
MIPDIQAQARMGWTETRLPGILPGGRILHSLSSKYKTYCSLLDR